MACTWPSIITGGDACGGVCPLARPATASAPAAANIPSAPRRVIAVFAPLMIAPMVKIRSSRVGGRAAPPARSVQYPRRLLFDVGGYGGDWLTGRTGR